jgi:hypothetical protein
MLVKVNRGKSITYINIEFSDIAKITLAPTGEGQRMTRGAINSIELKSGVAYLTNYEEAQRLVDAMRENDEGKA